MICCNATLPPLDVSHHDVNTGSTAILLPSKLDESHKSFYLLSLQRSAMTCGACGGVCIERYTYISICTLNIDLLGRFLNFYGSPVLGPPG